MKVLALNSPGSKAGCKLQFGYDYLTGEFQILEEMKGTVPDQKYTCNIPSIIKKGGIVLSDLGYWAFVTFFDISKKGAFFLTRLNTQVRLWKREGNTFIPVDLMETLKGYSQKTIELDLYLKKGTRFIKVRLVGYSAPEEVANIRIMKKRRASQRNGKTTSKQSLFYCDWSLFITNADIEIMPGKMLRTFY